MNSGATGTADEPFDLGVLVVHGIGDQKRGATLSQWADSLHNWLETWTPDSSDRPLASVTIGRTDLAPERGVPANLTMHLDLKGDETQRWLMAEGWWAGTFEPPSFGELWTWSFRSVPATAAMHANAIFSRSVLAYKSATGFQRIREGARIGMMMLAVLSLVLVSPAVIVLLTVLLLAGAIASALPIPAVKAAVLRAQLVAVGTIGDSLRLVESPTQAGAIKAPVADGLEWLQSKGCKKVVLLAHSQGAAVSYKVLLDVDEGRNTKIEPIDSFITVGSGLPKVNTLEHLSHQRRGLGLHKASMVVPVAASIAAGALAFLYQEGSWVGLVGMAVVAVLSAPWLIKVGFNRYTSSPPAGTRSRTRPKVRGKLPVGETYEVSLVPVIATSLAMLGVALASDHGVVTLIAAASVTLALLGVVLIAVDRIPVVESALMNATTRWLDLYAIKDPVPAGPTLTSVEGRPEAWPVSNLQSSIRDHTYYSLNVDECMTYVGIELLEAAAVTSQGRSVRSALADYGFHRRWRVMWRSGITYFLAAAAALFAYQTFEGTDRRVIDGYAELIKDEGVVDAALLWFDVQKLVPEAMSTAVANWVVAIGYILGGFALISLGHYFWDRWDRVEVDAEMGPGIVDRNRVYFEQQGLIVFHALVGFVAIWPRVALEGWRRLDFQSWDSLGVLAALLGGLFLVGWVVPKILGALKVQDRVRRRSGGRLDKTVAIAQYELNRGDFSAAVASFERAYEITNELQLVSPATTSGFAQARDLLTHRTRENAWAIQSGNAGGRAQTAHEVLGEDYLRRTLELYREASGNPSPNPALHLRLANYEFVHNSDAEAALGHLAEATRVAPFDFDVLLGQAITHASLGELTEASRALANIHTARRESSMQALAAPIELGAETAIYIMFGPTPQASTRLASINEALGRGVREPLADLRPIVANMPSDWSEDDKVRLRLLVNQVNGLDVEAVVDLRKDETDPVAATVGGGS